LSLIGAISLAIWLYLLLFHGGYWRARERLPEAPPVPPPWPAIVALLPARDEAETIKEVLERLVAQDYPGALSILLVDDDSEDGTGVIADDVARAAPPHRPVTVLTGVQLPEGWTGKLWALAQGVERAQALRPDAEFFLFTDADIGHGPHQLRRLVAQAQAHQADLVSLMARLRCTSFWERLLIPAFVYFFQKLYPFAWANDPRRRTAAARSGPAERASTTLPGWASRIRSASSRANSSNRFIRQSFAPTARERPSPAIRICASASGTCLTQTRILTSSIPCRPYGAGPWV